MCSTAPPCQVSSPSHGADAGAAVVSPDAYVARVSLVDAKSFNYLGDNITGGRATVTTQVTTKRGSTINVAYALERDADHPWRVQDVLVEGMSLLENYRTQFTSIITRSSYEVLVQRLRSRVQEHG